MVFKLLCVLVLKMKVAQALEGLRLPLEIVIWNYETFDNNFGIEMILQNIFSIMLYP